MISLSARAPSSPPVLAIAVTASVCPARALSSSAGIARGSLSRPSANAAAACTTGVVSFSTGRSRSTAAASPMRPAASAPWRRTAGFAWLSASRSGAASKRRASEAARIPASTPTVVSSAGNCARAPAAPTRRKAARLETNRVRRGAEQLTHVLRKARKSLLRVQRDQRCFGGGEQIARFRPFDRIPEDHPPRGQIPHPAAHSNHIIIARGLAVTDVNVGHGKIRPLLFQLLVGHAVRPQVLRAGHVHPDQIIRVIHEPHLIGLGVVHAMRDRRYASAGR